MNRRLWVAFAAVAVVAYIAGLQADPPPAEHPVYVEVKLPPSSTSTPPQGAGR